MRPREVTADLSDEDLKQASGRAREQGRRALKRHDDALAAFWACVLGELQAERRRRLVEDDD